MSISQVNAQQSVRAAMAFAAVRSNAAAAASPGTSRQPDAVTLSDAARALSAATRSVADAADIRTDKVAAIKAAIANGTYSVDSRQLARAMVKALTS